MRRKVGRPAGSKSPKLKLKPDEKLKIIQRQIRLTEKEDEDIQKAAEIMKVKISQLIRDAALEKAEKIIRKSNR